MKQKINLTISKPCSEKFNQFNQTEKGGFCNSCQKEVIDFRNIGDKQLSSYFKNKDGKTCGYFEKSQLSRNIQMPEFKQPTRFKFLRVAAITFLSLTSLHHIQAQEQKPKTEIVATSKEVINNQKDEAKGQKKLLTGTVSVDGTPLPGANIVLKGTTIGTATNFDGEFEFPKTLKQGDVLVVSYLGYTTQNIKMEKEQNLLNVIMQEDVSCFLMGEVEVNEVYESKLTLWQKIKNIF